MNQSELIDRVAQAAELNQRAAGQAVKAVVNAILDSLVAGESVRVSGLGTFNVMARPAREGRNPQSGAIPRWPSRQGCPQSVEGRSSQEVCPVKDRVAEVSGCDELHLGLRRLKRTTWFLPGIPANNAFLDIEAQKTV